MRVIDCATASEIASSSAAATLPPFNSTGTNPPGFKKPSIELGTTGCRRLEAAALSVTGNWEGEALPSQTLRIFTRLPGTARSVKPPSRPLKTSVNPGANSFSLPAGNSTT